MTLRLLVTLQVKDFEALQKFETLTNLTMQKYGGCIEHAYELEKAEDGTGREIHIVRFDSADGFERYRSDPDMAEQSELRNQAIKHTEIAPITQEKRYA